jgi:hypothetical protein
MNATFKSLLRRLLRIGWWTLKALVLTGIGLWSIAAVYYSNLPWEWLRMLASAVCAVALIAVLLLVRPRRRGKIIFLAIFALVVVWFLLIPPSNNRDWQPDVAVLPYADVNGDHIVLHNIRNCDYRSQTDYTVRLYDKTLDVSQLESVDLYLVYWGSPLIAHTMLSFGFKGGDYVCFSIETRKQIGENYSAIKGFFRQYELFYVVGDERDLVRVRTTFRGEQVYLYRLNTDPSIARSVFLDYLKAVNRLKAQPEWYNAMTSNCTTNIRGHTKPYTKNSRFDWRILFNGRIDEMAYERKALVQSLPFHELKTRSLINATAKAADDDPAFSRRIREHLPGFTGAPARAPLSVVALRPGIELNGQFSRRQFN